ncbi:MAG TPA: hypothetical protein DHV41_04240 [Parachlamydiales bacterium]|nr:hypothetical protein [Parachlamydiales bacterium]
MTKRLEEHTLHSLRSLLEKSGPLAPLRKQAWELFLQGGLSSLAPLVKRQLLCQTEKKAGSFFKESQVKPASFSLVFVNGAFQPRLSLLPLECTVLPLSQALRSYGSFLESKWRKSLSEKNDPLALLNLALHKEGVLIYLPEVVRLERPLRVLFFGDASSSYAFPRIHLYVSARSSLSLSLRREGELPPLCTHLFLECDLGAGASLTLHRVGVRGEAGGHFDSFRFALKRQALLKMVSAFEGSGGFFQDIRFSLQEEEAQCELFSLAHLKGQGDAHTQVRALHLAPFTKSSQLFKAALHQGTRSHFEGAIEIAKKGARSEARQLSKALLLEEGALASSRPFLNIHADDVKAEHGATLSPLREEELFYLKTRGLSTKEAQEILLTAFCKEILLHLTEERYD